MSSLLFLPVALGASPRKHSLATPSHFHVELPHGGNQLYMMFQYSLHLLHTQFHVVWHLPHYFTKMFLLQFPVSLFIIIQGPFSPSSLALTSSGICFMFKNLLTWIPWWYLIFVCFLYLQLTPVCCLHFLCSSFRLLYTLILHSFVNSRVTKWQWHKLQDIYELFNKKLRGWRSQGWFCDSNRNQGSRFFPSSVLSFCLLAMSFLLLTRWPTSSKKTGGKGKKTFLLLFLPLIRKNAFLRNLFLISHWPKMGVTPTSTL